MMTQALSIAETIVGRECRLEDLARRLAREIGIEITPDRKYHGISARTWLSGENKEYRMSYTEGDIYSDGKGGVEYDEEGGDEIYIKRVMAEYPQISVASHSKGYIFEVNVPDYMLNDFLTRKIFDPSEEPINLFHIKLSKAIPKQAVRPKYTIVYKGDPDSIIHPFVIPFFQGDIENINGRIIMYYLS